jgi:putative ABC transport system permease protein
MLVFEIISMAWRALGANKLRSALTTSGISIGIFSIISVMTVIAALQTSIESGISYLGVNIFQFAKFPNGFVAMSNPLYKNRRNIDFQDYLEYRRLMGDAVDVICPKYWEEASRARYQNRETNPNVRLCGTNEGFIHAHKMTIAEGRNISPEDVEFSRSVCVIGDAIVKRLFPQGRAVGKTINVGGRNFEVIGTFQAKGSSSGNAEDNFCILPITKFMENFGTKERTIFMATQAKNQLVYEQTLGRAIGAFRKARGLAPEERNDFEIYSNDSLAAAFRNVAGTIRIGAFVISTIALIAAGVGIMNIMLVSVTERTKEIGVRKSLGARQADIRLQFLLEALFLSLIGAIFGIGLGVLAGNGLAAWLQANPVFPWGWAIAGVIVCSAIGIGFGLYPAHKAASLDPIEALRYE